MPLSGAAERRLARLAGLSLAAFDRIFDRVNLLREWPGKKERLEHHTRAEDYRKHQSAGDLFNLELARAAAGGIDVERRVLVVLLGVGVARAFGLPSKLLTLHARGACTVLVFPHPSGVSHFWNGSANAARAADVLRGSLRGCGLLRPAAGEVAVDGGSKSAGTASRDGGA